MVGVLSRPGARKTQPPPGPRLKCGDESLLIAPQSYLLSLSPFSRGRDSAGRFPSPPRRLQMQSRTRPRCVFGRLWSLCVTVHACGAGAGRAASERDGQTMLGNLERAAVCTRKEKGDGSGALSAPDLLPPVQNACWGCFLLFFRRGLGPPASLSNRVPTGIRRQPLCTPGPPQMNGCAA